MSQDPYEEFLRQEQQLLRRTGCWFRLFEGVAGLTLILYALAGLIFLGVILFCVGSVVWKSTFE